MNELNGNNGEGKVVLVTGAGSGLGEAIAHTFSRAGWTVACVDINATCLDSVTSTLNVQGGTCAGFLCDVSQAEAVFKTVEDVIQRFGRLDVVVNNAAIDHTMSIDEMTVEQWDQVIGVNLRGPFLFAKAALPQMEKQNSGHIVNVASTAATRAWANAAAYHASKWGLVGFGRGLSVEGRPHNIRVTTIFPGGMRTHFFDRFEAQGIPMPDMDKLQDPARVAETILFAVSMPSGSAIQEVMVTPLAETSWP